MWNKNKSLKISSVRVYPQARPLARIPHAFLSYTIPSACWSVKLLSLLKSYPPPFTDFLPGFPTLLLLPHSFFYILFINLFMTILLAYPYHFGIILTNNLIPSFTAFLALHKFYILPLLIPQVFFTSSVLIKLFICTTFILDLFFLLTPMSYYHTLLLWLTCSSSNFT